METERECMEQRGWAEQVAALEVKLADTKTALCAVLLFFAVGPWDRQRKLDWSNTTRGADATTVGLCDMIRRTLARCSDAKTGSCPMPVTDPDSVAQVTEQ